MYRRHYLATGFTLAISAIAGCSGSEDVDGEDRNGDGYYSGTGTEHYEGTWTDTDVSGTWQFTVDWETGEIEGWTAGDVEVDITGSAEDGAIDAEGEAAMGTVTWSGSFSADGESVSGEWSGLDYSGTWSGSRVESVETPTKTSEETTEENGSDDTEAVTYGEIFTYVNNYAVEIELEDPDSGQTGSATAKYYGEDYYSRLDFDGTDETFEFYNVDGDKYLVIDGEQCYLNPGSAVMPDNDVQSESDAEAYDEKADINLEPSGTTEIDGESVYIFEITSPDDDELTLYVSVETGYLRRAEATWGQADFFDWNEVDPITEPDMDCQEVSF